MASLIDNDSDYYDYFHNVLIPLSFYGFGSIEDLLNLKISEIHELKVCMKDKELKDLFYSMKGLVDK